MSQDNQNYKIIGDCLLFIEVKDTTVCVRVVRGKDIYENIFDKDHEKTLRKISEADVVNQYMELTCDDVSYHIPRIKHDDLGIIVSEQAKIIVILSNELANIGNSDYVFRNKSNSISCTYDLSRVVTITQFEIFDAGVAYKGSVLNAPKIEMLEYSLDGNTFNSVNVINNTCCDKIRAKYVRMLSHGAHQLIFNGVIFYNHKS